MTDVNAMISKVLGRLPTKVLRRALPVYIACVFLVLFLWNLDSLGSAGSSESSDVGSLLKRELSHFTTRKAIDHIPKKIWQTWKVDPLGFEERDLAVARTWTQKNPGHRYEVLTDSNDLYYVETHFGPTGFNRPDIVYMYRSLTLKIIKADLLRYLIMYVEGGLYADIDVEALRPIERYIPDRYHERDIDMVIGVEIDQPEFKNHPVLGKKSESFCQWTFMCKPGLPVMLRLIDDIVKWLNEVSKKQKVPVSEIVLDFDEVISGTGPSAFTGAVLAEMSVKAGRSVTWKDFHGLSESKLLGGVLVLTVEAFAAGQGHSDSGNHNARTALVKHRYHASGWPTTHHRYKHPVFGEVEKCNWDPECVKIWDYSMAAFEQLSPEEQAKQTKDKEIADAAEAEKEEQLKKIGDMEKLAEAEKAANLEKLGQWEREQAKLKAEELAKKVEAEKEGKGEVEETDEGETPNTEAEGEGASEKKEEEASPKKEKEATSAGSAEKEVVVAPDQQPMQVV